MDKLMAITAIGPDRAGLIRDLSQAVSGSGGSIRESRMIALGSEFAALMLVAGNWHTVNKIRDRLTQLQRDTGISGAGNPRLQSTMVQLAWSWLRSQPGSALARWYQARFGVGGRARRIGIVALARKLLIALWRWATTGALPEGAIVLAR